MKKSEKATSSSQKKATAASRTKRTVTPKLKITKRNTSSEVISFPHAFPASDQVLNHRNEQTLSPSERSITIRDAKQKRVMLLCEMDKAWEPSTEVHFRHCLRMLFKEIITMKIDDNLLESLSLYQPDVLLMIGNKPTLPFPKDVLPWKGLKAVLWLNDVHEPLSLSTDIPCESSMWDLVITQNSEHIATYQSHLSSQIIYLPFGADPDLFSPATVPLHLQSDLILLGDYTDRLVPYLDIIRTQIQHGRILALGENWDEVPGVEAWQQTSEHELAQLFNGADMIVSWRKDQCHRFTIAACGGFLIAEEHMDLHRYMSPGDDCISFQNPGDLGAHLAHYKAHPEEKRRIASGALTRSMYNYSFFHLMMDFTNDILTSALEERRSSFV
ncbi:glycosyltransferase [Paenibacillus sp. Marseille-Q4541]|uniref:glycosyltransferase family protein n=1 Tax=Paenibacillus sp. Marseille-Q4541 TaxID=2831522 RepID=UPI001BA52F53|nr:glycosyltransferase [Paenibacillus sp. Marseille-Q4541]